MKAAIDAVLGAAVAVALLALGGCAAAPSRFEYSRPSMGTEFRIVLYAESRARADQAAAAAFARIDELDARLSDWRDDSELADLARRSAAPSSIVPTGPIRASDDLWRVLLVAQEISKRSDGAFDVTVGPLVQLWRRAKRQGELPAEAALAAARAATGFQKLRLDAAAHTVEFAVGGMRLDLGGIAKGDALDQALAVLREQGIERALVDGGGDVAASAPPPGESGWIVALAELDGSAPRVALRLAHAALATSGDTERYVEIGGRRFSHIVDPRTGLGLERRTLASAIARDGATADALATAVSVVGPERFRRLVDGDEGADGVGGAAARVVTSESGTATACASAGWPPMMPAPSSDR